MINDRRSLGYLFHTEKSSSLAAPIQKNSKKQKPIYPDPATGFRRGCVSLSDIALPAGMKTLGASAFEGCTALTQVSLPEKLQVLDKHIFYNCTNLKELFFEGNAPEFHPYALLNLTAKAYYPVDNKNWTPDIRQNYGGNITWVAYNGSENPDELPVSGTWGNLTWKIDTNGTLTLSGQGDMIHYQDPNAPWDPSNPPVDGYPWHRYADRIVAVVVEEGVTTLAEIAFHGLKNLNNVTLPNSLLSIDDAAFIYCTILESITVPQQLSSIGKDVFVGCTGFHEMIFTGDAPAFDPETFSTVMATAYYPAEGANWAAAVNSSYGGNITWVALRDGNDIILGSGELADCKSAWIDGVEYPIISDGTNVYVDLPDGVVATNLIICNFHPGEANDVHTQYPVSMKVWMLERNEDGSYKAMRIEEMDDILQYDGTSIRITGNKGIRMITSVPKAKKDALTGGGLAGYRLLEYGTVLAQTSKMDGPLTLGQSYARSNYAYKRGVADPVFAYSGNRVQYTNVLVGFNMDQCKEDIAMCSYMILEDAEGAQITLYGGIVYRSIGYVAYQNRSVFAPGSAAYSYVWEIIHHVYGDKYDAEYKG